MLKQYLLNNFEALEQVVQDIISYNGELEYLLVWDNDEDFFEAFFHNKPMEAVRSAYYGDYNYNDKYVKFDGYENLESLNEYEYELLLKENIDEIVKQVRSIIDEYDYFDDKVVELANEEIQKACNKYFAQF